MSADIALSTTSSKNPFETARRKLIAGLLKIKAPASYPAFPTPSDHEAVAAHIREAAAIFDEWLAAIGSEVRDNAASPIDANLFAGSFLGAVDGNETWASLLQPAVSSSAFLKAGVLGFQGGGKTLTSALALMGLYKYTLELGLHDGSKPVAMFDTEKGRTG
jgi:hypothetical protein